MLEAINRIILWIEYFKNKIDEIDKKINTANPTTMTEEDLIILKAKLQALGKPVEVITVPIEEVIS